MLTQVGCESMPRTAVVKCIWAHIKANDLQDPSDKRYIKCDDALLRVLGTPRVHMFKMNKILAKHMAFKCLVVGLGLLPAQCQYLVEWCVG